MNLIRREVGEHSQDLVQTREEVSPDTQQPGCCADGEAPADTPPSSRASTAEATLHHSSSSKTRRGGTQASHGAGDGMDVDSSQQVPGQEQPQVQGQSEAPLDMDVQGEAPAAAAAATEEQSGGMSPHRMGSIVRKGNRPVQCNA